MVYEVFSVWSSTGMYSNKFVYLFGNQLNKGTAISSLDSGLGLIMFSVEVHLEPIELWCLISDK